VHVAWLMTLALAATLAEPPPERPEAESPAPFAGLHILVRLADDFLTGHDLRYEGGLFRLRQREGDVAFAEERVLQVQFVDPRRDEFRDPVGLAIHVAHLRRGAPLKRLLLQRFGEGVLLRPEDPLAETFHRLVPKMWHPDLAALLCAEAARRCFLDRRPKDAVMLFEAAAAAEKARPDHAFVYGLMRVAALADFARPDEVQAAVRQLDAAYPEHRREIFRFGLALREELPDRPGPPRMLKGLK